MKTEDEAHLRAAIAEARAAEQAGEVPVGAVIVHNNEVIAKGQNRVIRDADPTAHAEIVALRAAGRALQNYRLEHCTLYTTLEPCAMCAGAILHARIDRLVFAASDPKAGACGSVLAVMNHPLLNHRVQVEPGLLAEECGAILTNFFRSRRKSAAVLPVVSIRPGETTAEALPMATKKSAKKTDKAAKTPKIWYAKVDTDSTHPDHGLFLEDAESIAKALASREVAPKGPSSGMRMLTFYINRAGKTLTEKRHKELEKAKKILSEMIASQKLPATSLAKKAANGNTPADSVRRVPSKTAK